MSRIAIWQKFVVGVLLLCGASVMFEAGSIQEMFGGEESDLLQVSVHTMVEDTAGLEEETPPMAIEEKVEVDIGRDEDVEDADKSESEVQVQSLVSPIFPAIVYRHPAVHEVSLIMDSASSSSASSLPPAPFSIPENDVCSRLCPYSRNFGSAGFPPLEDATAVPTEIISPTMFRDFADYVLAWPFAVFEENDIAGPTPAAAVANKCSPPIPIVYTQINRDVTVVTRFLDMYRKANPDGQVILITGQSDFTPLEVKWHRPVLGHPAIYRWLAQNVDSPETELASRNNKLIPVPIGLNYYINVPHMKEFLSEVEVSGWPEKDRLLLVNFWPGSYHDRPAVFDAFCNEDSVFNNATTCTAWDGQEAHVMSDQSADYRNLSRAKYIVAPRGNGIDTHRAWESLYVKAVPIMQSSTINSLFEGLPVIIVNEITPEFIPDPEELERLYDEIYRPMFEDPAVQRRLTRFFWFTFVENLRQQEMQRRGLVHFGENRRQCWPIA